MLVLLTCIHDTQHHGAHLSTANFLFSRQVFRNPFTGLRELKSRFVIIVRLSLSDQGEIRLLIKRQYV